MPINSRLIAAFVILPALTGCGGGGNSSSTSLTGPWSGTYTLSSNSGSANATTGALSSEDDGYFANNNGDVFVLSSLPGTSPFTATLTGIAPPGQTFSNGYSAVNFTVSGSYTSSGSGINMQATFTENDNQGTLSGSFNLTSNSPYNGTSTLTGLQGQWSGYYVGQAGTSINLNFGSDGSFAGSDGYGCVLSGSLTPDAPNTNQSNLYDVALGSSGEGCAGTVDGLAYESSKDVTGVFGGASGTYLEIVVFGPFTAYVMELKL